MELRDDAAMFYEKLFSPICQKGNSVQSKYSQTGRNKAFPGNTEMFFITQVDLKH